MKEEGRGMRERERTLAVKGHEPLGSGFIDPRKPDGETKRER